MREGDRLHGHIDGFKPGGAYGSWKLVEDWVILDFRQTEPPATEQRGKKQPNHSCNKMDPTNPLLDNPNLYVVIFYENLELYKVLDGNHNVVIPERNIFYT